MTLEKPDRQTNKGPIARAGKNRMSLLSHDLRSALSDILGGLRLVDKERLDSETQLHFDRIAASGETLARLLEKSLIDDATGAEHPVTVASNINFNDFLNDIRRRWTDRASEKGIDFKVEISSSLPAITTLDRVSLDRVIANLVGNSIKYTDEGQVVMSVSCKPDKTLCFCVSDDGPGFSDAALAQLFQYEGRPTGNEKPGNGLGLFIAKELSDVLGANLSVENQSNGGAIATLLLPHEVWFDRSLRREGKSRGDASKKPVDLSGLRILLAEDNKTNQLVATQMLRAMGADFAVASDGLEALEMLQVEEFDLALLDIEMPRMTGLELIKTLRMMPAPLGEMPLIALTAYVMREHRERIYGAGADGIIAKPVMSISELGQSILDYLDNLRTGSRVTPAASASARPNEIETVDRKIFDTLVETIGADSTSELLSKLQADTDTVAEGLVRGQQSLDLVEIRSQTHILVSVAGAIGATTLQHIAQRLNAAANRQEAAEVDRLCEKCLSGLRALQEFILDEQKKAEPVPQL